MKGKEEEGDRDRDAAGWAWGVLGGPCRPFSDSAWMPGVW